MIRSRILATLVGGSMFSASMLLAAGAPARAAIASGGWDSVVAAAETEGVVNFYSNQTVQIISRIAAAFKSKYPKIDVQHVRLNSGPIIAKLEQEQSSGVAGGDVTVHTETPWFIQLAKKGELIEPTGPAAKDWPKAYLRAGIVPIGGLDPFVILYNTRRVSNPPKGYADLLKPEFAGKIGTTEPIGAGAIAYYEWLEKNIDPAYLEKLKAQRPRLYNGTTAITQAVASGEISVSTYAVLSSVGPLVDQGAPIKHVLTSPNIGTSFGMGLPRWAKHPNAGLVFLDFLMSSEGQAAWHGKGDSASPLPNIKNALAADSITPFDPDAYPRDAVVKYRERWLNIFK